MRAEWLYLAVSVVSLLSSCPTITAQRYAVLPREATTSPEHAAAASTNLPKTSSSAEATPSSSSSDGTSSISGIPAKATNAAAASSSALVTATPIAKGSLNVNGTTVPNIEGLPIHPRITPALAVAGTTLILTGALYTIIGIKTKWLHIFLSTAYIFALAVSILIEFVMHTPVSDAAQGGYFVAACLTGLVAGGISFLFKDVTEGISCFLGGFCLSMWVLVLRAGGTISSTTGKIIFISCLTVAAPALYISRRTRPYGLIGATSFAGATAVVLGIDCFSRAGLKEFWLYIWNLNNGIFPLHYNGPYPITRGIQVETGAIIIVCAMGILSQTKVWRVIKRRREDKAREQRRRDEEGNMADEEHGRRVEDDIKRERGSWEAAYGGGERGKSDHTDSGNGTDEPSTRKGSLSVIGNSDARGSDAQGIEMQEIEASANGPEEARRLVVHVIQDDEIRPNPSATSQHPVCSSGVSREPSVHEAKVDASNPSGTEASLGDTAAIRSVDPNLTLKPKISHLPFKVPDLDYESEDGRSSVAASAASGYTSDRWSKRLSGSSSLVRKLSKRPPRSFIAVSTSDEALMVPDPEDDRASSIAATIDGVSDKDDMEELPSIIDERPSFEILSQQDSMQAVMRGNDQVIDLAEDAEKSSGQSSNVTAIRDAEGEGIGHFHGSIDLWPESIALPESDASTSDARSTVEEPNTHTRANVAAGSEALQQKPRTNKLSTNLPGGASKVVTAYRTNEWAKHLDGADSPALDDLNIKKSRSLDSAQLLERSAPVDVRGLQQTPLNAEPPPVLTVKTHGLAERPVSFFQPDDPLHRQQDQQRRDSAVHRLTREKAMEKRPSQTYLTNTMERSPSQTSLINTKSRKEQYRPPLPKFRSSQSSVISARGLRSSSSPVLSSPLAESPIAEGVEASFPTRFAPSSTHLLSQRDSMVRNRPSSTSLLQTEWSNATPEPHPPLRTLNEDEDIPLSRRRSLLLQQNSRSTPHLHRSSSGPMSISGVAARPIYPQNVPAHPSRNHRRSQPIPVRTYPSSPVPRDSTRDSTYSAWRASLQPSATAHYREQEIEARRATLMDEKRRESVSRQEQNVRQTRTQHVLDRGMRQSSMIELHQQQMRKMQAEANRSLAA